MAKVVKKLVAKDPLDLLAEGDPKNVMALMLWKVRHRYPQLSMEITKKDIEQFKASCDYMGVKVGVAIIHPQGREATPGRKAEGDRPAVPPRPAEPPRPWVFVGVVEKDEHGELTMNSVTPIESDEEGAVHRDHQRRVQTMKDRAGLYAQGLLQMANSNSISTSEMTQAAQLLRDMASVL